MIGHFNLTAYFYVDPNLESVFQGKSITHRNNTFSFQPLPWEIPHHSTRAFIFDGDYLVKDKDGRGICEDVRKFKVIKTMKVLIFSKDKNVLESLKNISEYQWLTEMQLIVYESPEDLWSKVTSELVELPAMWTRDILKISSKWIFKAMLLLRLAMSISIYRSFALSLAFIALGFLVEIPKDWLHLSILATAFTSGFLVRFSLLAKNNGNPFGGYLFDSFGYPAFLFILCIFLIVFSWYLPLNVIMASLLLGISTSFLVETLAYAAYKGDVARKRIAGISQGRKNEEENRLSTTLEKQGLYGVFFNADYNQEFVNKIFISYHGNDVGKNTSQTLYKLLDAKTEAKTFIDRLSLGGGNWEAQLAEALSLCGIFISVIPPGSKPDWLEAELRVTNHLNIVFDQPQLIVILVDHADKSEWLEDILAKNEIQVLKTNSSELKEVFAQDIWPLVKCYLRKRPTHSTLVPILSQPLLNSFLNINLKLVWPSLIFLIISCFINFRFPVWFLVALFSVSFSFMNGRVHQFFQKFAAEGFTFRAQNKFGNPESGCINALDNALKPLLSLVIVGIALVYSPLSLSSVGLAISLGICLNVLSPYYLPAETFAHGTDLHPYHIPGILGFELENLQAGRHKICNVEQGSAASIAGLQPGDSIVAIYEEPTRIRWDLFKTLSWFGTGEKLLLKVYRDGEIIEKTLIFPEYNSTLNSAE